MLSAPVFFADSWGGAMVDIVWIAICVFVSLIVFFLGAATYVIYQIVLGMEVKRRARVCQFKNCEVIK